MNVNSQLRENSKTENVAIDKSAAVEVSANDKESKCGLCHQGHVSHPLEAGKLYTILGSTVHYFCMLFTAYSKQLGEENEGLFGFYGEEVKNQIKKASSKKCFYCSKTGATARCSKKYCNVVMHFTCGISNGSMFQFFDKMFVMCKTHRRKQKIDKFPIPSDNDCIICYEEVSQDTKDYKKLHAPCCGRIFHRGCIQRYACSSGSSHFKCANCNNKDTITKEFLKMGIYFPTQDASWELPKSSDFYNYQDMYVQHKKCDIKMCMSEAGRHINEENTDLEIILCSSCGINGAHGRCGKLDVKDEAVDFKCRDCGGDVVLSEDRPNQRRSRLAGEDLLDESEASILDTSAVSDGTISSVDSSFDISAVNDTNISDVSFESSLNEFVKKFELKTGHNDSSVLLLTDTSLDESVIESKKDKVETLKENFLKSSEQMSQLLEDIQKKKKEAEDKSLFVEGQSKAEREKTIGVPTGVIISEQKSPVRIRSSKIHIRTDIFCEEANILNEDPVVEDVDEMDVESTTFEVSDKKRKFASKLATRSLQSLKVQKKNDEYLVSFYKIICPEKTKLGSSSKSESDTALQIVDSFSCEIDELLDSPGKSKGNEIKPTPSPSISTTNVPNAEPSNVEIDEEKGSNKSKDSPQVKYKPGPRSKTKPHISPVRIAPGKDKSTISSNEKSESITTLKPSENLVTTKDDVLKSKSADLNEDKTTESEPKRYRPGPKSRKKFLVIKEDVGPAEASCPSQSVSAKIVKSKELPNKRGEDIIHSDITATIEPKEVSTIVGAEAPAVIDDREVSIAVEPRKVECLQTNSKRKAVVDTEEEAKKQKTGDKSEDSIEAIKEFIQDTDTIMEVDAAPPNQEAVDRRRAKRPFQCPVCEGFFRSEMVLQQHMAKIHFWNKLLEMPKETQTAQGSVYQCSEFPCRYTHKMAVVVSGHLATEHKVVFRIALSLFPSFTLPPNPQTSKSNPVPVTIEEVDDDDCVAVLSGPVSATRNPTYVVTSTNNNNNIIKPVQTPVTVPLRSFALPSDTLLYQTPLLDSPVLLNNRNI